MKTLLISLILKFLTPANIASVMAKCIANLLRYASRNGGKAWDLSKEIIGQAQIWTQLFNEVYSDEEISQSDEEKIADAVEQNTGLSKIVDILKK